MQATLILNPASGDSTPNEQKAPRFGEILAGGGIAAEVEFISKDRTAGQIARDSVNRGTPLIIAGGGDGTVSPIAAELVGRQTALSVLPLGTYNNIARSLGMPPDAEEACRAIAASEIRAIDVGRAEGGRLFFEAAGVGLDAALFPAGHALKEGRWFNFFRALKLATGYHEQEFTLTFDRAVNDARHETRRNDAAQRSIRVRALFVVVANGPYYGSGFTIAPTARLDDGLLSVNIYRRFTKWELLRHFWSISGGKRRYSPKVKTFHVSEVRIETPSPLDVHGDGEIIGQTPVTFRAEAQTLKVRAPLA